MHVAREDTCVFGVFIVDRYSSIVDGEGTFLE